MVGASPLTVIVSSTAPMRRSALTVSTNEPVNSIPSCFTVLNPGRLNVTEYTPGRRSTIRYWPALSVTTVRNFSMSAGLVASTVTPGSTPPEASLTTPAIVAWAKALAGRPRMRRNDASCLATPMAVLRYEVGADLKVGPYDEVQLTELVPGSRENNRPSRRDRRRTASRARYHH